MTVTSFAFAILALLCTPGPTNTLMMLGGYARGWRGAMPLQAAELGGYLAVVVPVAALVAPVFDAYPQASNLVKLGAVAWVTYLGCRLWMSSRPSAKAAGDVTAKQIFVTTVLNPKALIIALVLMPHGDVATLLPWLLLLAALILLAANGWILFGRMVRHNARLQLEPATVRRFAAGCLLLFAMILGGSSLATAA